MVLTFYESAGAAALGLIAFATSWYTQWSGRTNDGIRYQMMAGGTPMPPPFSLRLLPLILGKRPSPWMALNAVSLVLLCVLTAELARGHLEASGAQALLAAGLVAFMANTRKILDMVVTPDLAAMAAMTLMFLVPWELAFFMAPLIWMIRENIAIYGAVYHANPFIALATILPVVWRYCHTRKNPDPLRRESTTRPFKTGRRSHAKTLFEPQAMLLPWGMGLLALLALPQHPWLIVMLALSYGSMLVATDHVRIYQFPSAGVAAVAATVVPDQLVLPVLIVHIFWGWQGKKELG